MATYKRGSGNYKSSFLQMVIKTTNQQHNSQATLQDDTELKIDVRPNKKYGGFLLLYYKAHATPDIKIAFKSITGTSVAGYIVGSPIIPLTKVSFGTSATWETDDTNQIIIIYYNLVTGSSAGTLQFQHSQDTSDANDTKVYAGSYLVMFEA